SHPRRIPGAMRSNCADSAAGSSARHGTPEATPSSHQSTTSKFRRDPAAGLLFGGVAGFVGQQALFGAPAPAPFLAADFFNAVAFGLNIAFPEFFNLIKQEPPGKKTVEALLPSCLAFDLE